MRKASLLLAVGVFLYAPLLFAGTVSTPPFNQCPAVGADTSCGFLIVFNSGGGFGVYADPSQGPYDGADDTLVGVLNDTTNTVYSLTLTGSGNGGGAFAYDGDGLCTYISPAGCGSVSNNTDDWGPGVTFSNLTTKSVWYDTGTVNFTGGLAPGQSRYFSLESAFSANNPPVPGTPEPATLLLMGTGLVGIASRLRRRF